MSGKIGSQLTVLFTKKKTSAQLSCKGVISGLNKFPKVVVKMCFSGCLIKIELF